VCCRVLQSVLQSAFAVHSSYSAAFVWLGILDILCLCCSSVAVCVPVCMCVAVCCRVRLRCIAADQQYWCGLAFEAYCVCVAAVLQGV